jgi:hypothetical protein
MTYLAGDFLVPRVNFTINADTTAAACAHDNAKDYSVSFGCAGNTFCQGKAIGVVFH